ncbi:hypothetical protein SAMN02745121_06554 [Nannocystis exedens]|uniref:Uncharacterized protein n=1 Tax=Nannocystis exedens TaxID=54 RepID=A0A1I2FEA3_9BACT|nr:hypothetical protein [Nannocystis exedens]PCC70527.1 hypothetical protein NAEX_03591 [Nannocystis exedens]SFF02846.1 hypothetical protein SAMN02745121_06554 [Nannocystis exedens]
MSLISAWNRHTSRVMELGFGAWPPFFADVRLGDVGSFDHERFVAHHHLDRWGADLRDWPTIVTPVGPSDFSAGAELRRESTRGDEFVVGPDGVRVPVEVEAEVVFAGDDTFVCRVASYAVVRYDRLDELAELAWTRARRRGDAPAHLVHTVLQAQEGYFAGVSRGDARLRLHGAAAEALTIGRVSLGFGWGPSQHVHVRAVQPDHAQSSSGLLAYRTLRWDPDGRPQRDR